MLGLVARHSLKPFSCNLICCFFVTEFLVASVHPQLLWRWTEATENSVNKKQQIGLQKNVLESGYSWCLLIYLFATTEQCKLRVEFKILITWQFYFLVPKTNKTGSLLRRWKCSACHVQRGQGKPENYRKYHHLACQTNFKKRLLQFVLRR